MVTRTPWLARYLLTCLLTCSARSHEAAARPKLPESSLRSAEASGTWVGVINPNPNPNPHPNPNPNQSGTEYLRSYAVETAASCAPGLGK
eukprot:scaffold35957_cov31-Phaeocystis_antarctica.AAC.1